MSTARSGRRPGSPATREAILSAARERFSKVGYAATTMRAVAAMAEVDPALIHHYFGNKKDLFIAATDLPIDPIALVATLRSVPVDQLGEQILRTLLNVWESPAGASFVATMREIISGSDPTILPSFLLDVVLKDVRERVDNPKGSGRTRVSLVMSQIAGLAVARKILAVEPLASMPIDQVVTSVAPNIQRYLTGPM